jgi:hypothetical protein
MVFKNPTESMHYDMKIVCTWQIFPAYNRAEGGKPMTYITVQGNYKSKKCIILIFQNQQINSLEQANCLHLNT